ncbi:MAG TPA: cellulose binding domain-containing protein, partial [Polyangiaceae bacterium]
MKFRVRHSMVAVVLVGLFAGACSSSPEDGAKSVDAALVSADGSVTASISYDDWGAGYNGNVTVTNNGKTATTTWSVVVNTHGSAISQTWNATAATSGSTVTFTPLSWNAAIAPGQSVSFGFGAAPGGAANEAQLVSVTQSGSTGAGASGSAGAGGSGGTSGSAG